MGEENLTFAQEMQRAKARVDAGESIEDMLTDDAVETAGEPEESTKPDAPGDGAGEGVDAPEGKPEAQDGDKEGEGKDDGDGEPKGDEPDGQAESDEDPVADLSHGEKSKLGRKLKAQEQQIAGLSQQIEQLTQALQARAAAPAPAQADSEPPKGDDVDLLDVLSSRGKMEAFVMQTLERNVQAKNQKLSAYRAQYVNEFVKTTTEMGLDEDFAVAIWEEMSRNHKEIHSNSPKLDLRVNLNAARASLYEKQLAEKGAVEKEKRKASTAGGKPLAPAGAGPAVKPAAVGGQAMPKLDPKSAALVKRLGISPDDVRAYLGDDGEQK